MQIRTHQIKENMYYYAVIILKYNKIMKLQQEKNNPPKNKHKSKVEKSYLLTYYKQDFVQDY